MNAALSLASWSIAPLPDGTVQIGSATLPAFAAIDIANRILESAQSTAPEVARRVRVRQHLDRMFRDATPMRITWMADKTKAGVLGYCDGDRMHVRISDSASAWLLRDGGYARGFVLVWRDCDVFGPCAAMADGFLRVSARWIQPNVLEVQGG